MRKPSQIHKTLDELVDKVKQLESQNQELVKELEKCSEQLARLGYSANHADAALAKARRTE
jgi:uncharacterized protein YukE